MTPKAIKYSKIFTAFTNSYRNQPQTQYKRRPINIHFLSLKIWLPIFFIITALLYIIADYYPTLEDTVPYFAKIIFYLFAAAINIPIGYYILNKYSCINPQTNKNRNILSIMTVLIAVAGFTTAGCALMYYYNFKIHPVFGFFLNGILFKEFLYVFGASLSVTLGIIGTYLTFKFQKKNRRESAHL